MATKAPSPARPGIGLLTLGGIAFLVFGFSHYYVEYRWFASITHQQVMLKTLLAQLATGLAAGGILLATLLFNLRFAARGSRNLTPLHLHDPDGVPRINLGQLAQRLIIPYALLMTALYGLGNAQHWRTVILAIHGGSFGTTDPLFGNDVGFYIFQLPLLETLSSLALWTLILNLVGVVGIYATGGALLLSERGAYIHGRARAHLSVLGAAVLMVLAAESLLDVYRLLYSDLGPMTGASYADVHAKLPALRVKAGLCGVSAILLLVSARQTGLRMIMVAAGLYFASQLGVKFITNAVHRFSVVPNEIEKERPYLANNIEATRAAYGLDKVVERDLSPDSKLTAADIRKNADTIDNVRVWDHKPLLDTFAQIQEIRTYYDFASVDNDRYTIDGHLRQIMLSPRELAAESLPKRTWVNERFTFTHGYGIALGPVNAATPEGLPQLFVQDIPPVSQHPALDVTQPAIYFGELSNDHVFVRTHNREFDYPAGDGYEETDYDGHAGLRFDSTFTRMAIAAELRTLKVLLTNDIDSDSRVLLHRNVMERIRKVVPFALLDQDPYMIVREDGTLMWICDAYLHSNRYPYAEPVFDGAVNYIRNSIKVTVDAYHGDVSVYAADATDPLLQAWQAFLPETFKPMSAMPSDVRSHLRYPEQIFSIQTEMFTTYHMREAELLYNREDQWSVPAISTGEGGVQRMVPYYAVMRLPEEDRAEFILMLPFTPKRKDNLSAWMVARSDGEHLGELVVYRFPKDRLVFGPQQVVNRINQDAEISGQISLWDQRGSDAVFGTLLVIPVEESLLYVRPLYLRSEGGKIPELKRVIVVYEKRIAMEPSLQQALNSIFRTSPEEASAAASPPPISDAQAHSDGSQPGQPTPQVLGDGAPAALKHFERALSAQRAGDWAQYGEQIRAVEAVLRKMQPGTLAVPARPAPSTATGPAPAAPATTEPANSVPN